MCAAYGQLHCLAKTSREKRGSGKRETEGRSNCSRMMIQILEKNSLFIHFSANKANHQTYKLRATWLVRQLKPQLAFHAPIWSQVPASSLVPSRPAPLPPKCAHSCLFLGMPTILYSSCVFGQQVLVTGFFFAFTQRTKPGEW